MASLRIREQDLWTSDLTRWIHDLIVHNWNRFHEKREDDTKSLEFEIRLGRIDDERGGRFVSGTTKETFQKYQKYFQGAVKANVLQCTENITYAILFERDIRVLVKYRSKESPAYRTFAVERKSKVSSKTFGIVGENRSDLRVELATEYKVTDTYEREELSKIAEDALNQRLELFSHEVGGRVGVFQSDPILEIAGLPEDDPLRALVNVDGRLPKESANKFTWHVAHQKFAVDIAGFPRRIRGWDPIKCNNGLWRVVSSACAVELTEGQSLAVPEGKYSVLIDPRSFKMVAASVPARRRRRDEDVNSRRRIRFFRKKKRRSYSRNSGRWSYQYDMTITQAGETYDAMIASEPVYELELEISHLRGFRNPKEAAWRVSQEIIQTLLFRGRAPTKPPPLDHFLQRP